MLKFACFITGDNYQMLKSETTPSRKKVIALAMAVFVPTLMWFITGFLMVYAVFGKPLHTAIFAGLLAAAMIFIIEKLVVMSSGSKWLVMFRVLLAFLVAALGSVFLDEVIFSKDISQQMAINRDQLINRKKDQVQQSFNDEKVALEKTIQEKYATWQQSLQAAEGEADGRTGSGIPGVDAITRLKQDNAVTIQNDYLQTKKELEDLQLHILDEQEKAAGQVRAGFENNALLQRIKAMFDLVKTDGYMMGFYILITAILFTLEFLVVVFKVTMGKTNYERRLELIEEIGQRRMEKVRQNDLKYFEASMINNSYANAKKHLSDIRSTSLFN